MIAAVIPCYKVKKHIETVIRDVSRQVDHIFLVDDCCPEKSGKYAQSLNLSNVTVLFNEKNLGVGGADLPPYSSPLVNAIS